MDRVVWVTGAGSGIGRATAVAFAKMGARVALTGRRTEALADTAAMIGDAAIVVAADLSDPAEITRAHAAVVASLGPVEVLVNNAGSNTRHRHWHELAPEAMATMMDVNLRAPFLCSMAVLPAMRERKTGTLIHIASVSAVTMFPASGPAYGASKAGVSMMSAHLNAEEGIHGIRSICINPGEVATEILDRRPKPPSAEDRALMLHADDIAAAAVFAASLPGRATVADMTILATDNQIWRPFARGIAQTAVQANAKG
ncbi:SDR family oxidoreductase [Acidisphaera sp. L21]|uniref:SDR family oxidoreductase n=1 Tax=Acidisphaera sp. L21 TaxID=1641851 RepID=UPI00131DB148|nr:SDR family oxidoreductase [Acidisphaera sp. L21]